MALPYYYDYAAHAFRFYAENMHQRSRLGILSKAEIQNWNCVLRTLNKFSKTEQNLVLEMNRYEGTIGDCVRAMREKYAIPVVDIWDLTNRVFDEFARQRGLI